MNKVTAALIRAAAYTTITALPICDTNMTLKLLKFKTLLITVTGLVVVFLLLAWLALPGVLQSQAEKFIAEKTGCRLVMDKPRFNPLSLRLHLSGLQLTRPDGAPLLAFRELKLKLSGKSLLQHTLIFDDIQLEGLTATGVLLAGAKSNWSVLLDAFKPKPSTTTEAPPPRLDIRHFRLSDARLDFSDQRISPAFSSKIEALNLELTDISTLPNEHGQFKVSATTTFGARVDWHGETSIEPLQMTGSLLVAGADLSKLANYFSDRLILHSGIAGISTDYRLAYANGKLGLNLEHLHASLKGLKVQGKRASDPLLTVDSIEAKQGSFDLAKGSLGLGTFTVSGSKLDLKHGVKPQQLGNLSLENAQVDLNSHHATLSHIKLEAGSLFLSRNAAGRIDLLDALPSKPSTKSTPSAASPRKSTGADWHYRVDQLELKNYALSLHDKSVEAEFVLQDIALGLQGISEDWKAAVPLQASFKIKSGGSFTAKGQLVPALPSADIQLELAGLALTPAQPYLAVATNLKLTQGKFATKGRVIYNPSDTRYLGSFNLSDLLLNEASDPFLSLKSLNSRAFEVSPARLVMDELSIVGLSSKLIIDKDKSVSVTRIMRPATAAPAPAPATSTQGLKPAFLVNIDRLRFSQGELDYADYSLAIPFATHIHDLHGIITGISTRTDAASQLELDGQVDEYGLARATGQVTMSEPTNLMDLNRSLTSTKF